MHELFPEWYGLNSIVPTAELLAKRWAGIEKVVTVMNNKIAFDIVRMFMNLRPLDPEFIGKFISTFQEADPIFPTRNNELELQILAGSSIVECIRSNSPAALNIAYATICSQFQGLGKPAIIPDVAIITRNFLTTTALNIRNIDLPPDFKIAQLNAATKKALDEGLATNNPPNAFPSISNITKEIDLAIKSLGVSTKGAVEILSNALFVEREKSNILWWVFGEYSRDRQCHISEIQWPAVCLIAGKELSDLITVMPGPDSALAFLSKMIWTGRKKVTAKVSLKEAVMGLPGPWKEEFVKMPGFDGVEDLCPAFFAIRKSVEGGNNDSWLSFFEKAFKIKPDTKMSPVKLAMQLHEECLLADNLSE